MHEALPACFIAFPLQQTSRSEPQRCQKSGVLRRMPPQELDSLLHCDNTLLEDCGVVVESAH